MARNSIDEDGAFKLLRDHSQNTGRKLADLADAIVQSRLLLLPQQANGRPRTADSL
jgi:AmiR/NasT family two-component response regulator